MRWAALASQDLLGLAALSIFAVLPLLVADFVLSDFAIYFAYALFAVSLAFAWGHAGLLSLGHAVYFGIGAYAMSVVTLGMLPGLPDLRSTGLGLVVAILAGGGTAWLLGWFFFASHGLRGAFLGIVTLALAVVFERLAINATWLGGLNGLMNVPPINLGLNGDGPELIDALPLYYLMLALLAMVVAAMSRLTRSEFGVTLAAVRDNELRAWTLGHDVRRIKRRAFALSGAIAGLAGAMFVVQFGFASPSLIGFSLSADVLIWVALGGRGALVAAALGAIAVRFLDSRFSGELGATWPLIVGLLFMASVLAFPNGVFGEAILWLDRWRARGRRASRS
jgi:ABC-type branched-subunit amino acid transport system permease subunit